MPRPRAGFAAGFPAQYFSTGIGSATRCAMPAHPALLACHCLVVTMRRWLFIGVAVVAILLLGSVSPARR